MKISCKAFELELKHPFSIAKFTRTSTPILLLKRCMAMHLARHIKTDRAGLRALGPHPVPRRFFRILRHKCLELAL